jgi:hypothetical protein
MICFIILSVAYYLLVDITKIEQVVLAYASYRLFSFRGYEKSISLEITLLYVFLFIFLNPTLKTSIEMAIQELKFHERIMILVLFLYVNKLENKKVKNEPIPL